VVELVNNADTAASETDGFGRAAAARVLLAKVLSAKRESKPNSTAVAAVAACARRTAAMAPTAGAQTFTLLIAAAQFLTKYLRGDALDAVFQDMLYGGLLAAVFTCASAEKTNIGLANDQAADDAGGSAAVSTFAAKSKVDAAIPGVEADAADLDAEFVLARVPVLGLCATSCVDVDLTWLQPNLREANAVEHEAELAALLLDVFVTAEPADVCRAVDLIQLLAFYTGTTSVADRLLLRLLNRLATSSCFFSRISWLIFLVFCGGKGMKRPVMLWAC
jgi:hypothetical protein